MALLLGCLLALTLTAGEAPTPAVFQVRLVLDGPSPDSEELPLIEPGAAPNRRTEQKLHVQKTVLLDRSDVKWADAEKNRVTGAWSIYVKFTESGAKRFGEVTSQHVGQRLAIMIDGHLHSAPKVMSATLGGSAAITGTFTQGEATKLARRLGPAPPPPLPPGVTLLLVRVLTFVLGGLVVGIVIVWLVKLRQEAPLRKG